MFPGMIGTVSGTLITGTSLGSMLVPVVIGAVSDISGLRGGMMITILLAAILIVATVFLPQDREEQTAAGS